MRKPARSGGEKSRRSRRGVGRRLATARRYRSLYAFFEKRQEDGGPSKGVPWRKKRLKTRRLGKMKRIKRKNDVEKRVTRSGATRRFRRESTRRKSFSGAKPARRRERRLKTPRRRFRFRSKPDTRRPLGAFSSRPRGAKRCRSSPQASPTTAKKRKNRASTSCRPSKRTRGDRQ